VADIKHIPTGEGTLYLAVAEDAFSRRVVGWAIETYLRAELVLKDLNRAIGQRRPQGAIHHSDQGSGYTAAVFEFIEGWYNTPHPWATRGDTQARTLRNVEGRSWWVLAHVTMGTEQHTGGA